MTIDPQAALLIAVAVAGTVLVLELLRGRLSRWWNQRLRRRRADTARKGERDAEDLLASRGFEVLERQPRSSWKIDVDGDEASFEIQPDLLVRRGRRVFVAEVKTGRKAPLLSSSSTRRQLLEYAAAYGASVHGVLLVDMTNHVVRQVRFPIKRQDRERGQRWSPSGWIALGITVGVACSWVLVRYLS